MSTSAASRSPTGASSRELPDDLVPEALTDHRSGLQQPALVGSERIEAGRQHGVNAVGQFLDVAAVLLAKPVDHLLGEQRIAAGPAGHLLGQLAAAARGRTAAIGRGPRLPPCERGSSEIVVAFRLPPPQVGRRSSSSSRARQTISIGPWPQPARCSIRSSIPSSAQWMSSSARTTGDLSLSSCEDEPHRGEDPVADLLGIDVLDGLVAAVDSQGPGRSAPRCALRRPPPSPSDEALDAGDELGDTDLRRLGAGDSEPLAQNLPQGRVGRRSCRRPASVRPACRRDRRDSSRPRRARSAAATCRRPPARRP